MCTAYVGVQNGNGMNHSMVVLRVFVVFWGPQ